MTPFHIPYNDTIPGVYNIHYILEFQVYAAIAKVTKSAERDPARTVAEQVRQLHSRTLINNQLLISVKK